MIEMTISEGALYNTWLILTFWIVRGGRCAISTTAESKEARLCPRRRLRHSPSGRGGDSPCGPLRTKTARWRAKEARLCPRGWLHHSLSGRGGDSPRGLLPPVRCGPKQREGERSRQGARSASHQREGPPPDRLGKAFLASELTAPTLSEFLTSSPTPPAPVTPPLYTTTPTHTPGALQGYLAHNKTHPSWDYRRALGPGLR